MEQHTQDAASPEVNASPEITVSPEHSASPEHSTTQGRQRCRARRRDRKQCRLFAQDPASGLCARHAACVESAPDVFQDTTDLSKKILVVNDGDYGSVDSINSILSNVVELLAQGRISPRRASVITFALSLMLRSVIVQDRQAANAHPQIIFDAPRPIRDDDQPSPDAPEQRKETDMYSRPHT
ncbi:MAG: hypothetical protein WBE13_07225 [Candidatus Acidiferrum sp.]